MSRDFTQGLTQRGERFLVFYMGSLSIPKHQSRCADSAQQRVFRTLFLFTHVLQHTLPFASSLLPPYLLDFCVSHGYSPNFLLIFPQGGQPKKETKEPIATSGLAPRHDPAHQRAKMELYPPVDRH